MDAVIIGKHFTDDRTRKVSITCEEMHERLLRSHRGVTLRCHGGKTLTAAEQADAHEISFRRSVYAACDRSVHPPSTGLSYGRPAGSTVSSANGRQDRFRVTMSFVKAISPDIRLT